MASVQALAPGVITALSIGDLQRILTDISYEPEVMTDERPAPGTAAAPAGAPTGPYLWMTPRLPSSCASTIATTCRRRYRLPDLQVVTGFVMLAPVPSPAEIIS